jgi:hypothetical protein
MRRNVHLQILVDRAEPLYRSAALRPILHVGSWRRARLRVLLVSYVVDTWVKHGAENFPTTHPLSSVTARILRDAGRPLEVS